MRLIYSLVWWLALPIVVLRLFVRGRKEPGYRAHIGERLGFYHQQLDVSTPLIWVHAVSVGETRAAQPLIDALLSTYSHHAILLTHMTPTGRETGRTLFGNQPRVLQAYLPYDTDWMVASFLRYFQPQLGILMETEVWPTVMAQCSFHRVPVALVNARLSERSLRKALRLPGLFREAAGRLFCVAAQTDADAERIKTLGAPNVHVTGSIKFDVTPPQAMLQAAIALRDQLGSRPVLVCANTREGEEALIFDAFCKLDAAVRQSFLLTIVPRHPQRFNDVAAIATSHGLTLARRSQPVDAMRPNPDVFLGDTMGEMFAYYAACDVAFVGGNLMPLGGHNLIEACAVGRPVLIGPYTFNFADAANNAVAAGAAIRVADADDLFRTALGLLTDTNGRRVVGERALRFSQQHGGATQRTMQLLKPLIERQ